jgi:hypothetical protein
VTTTASVVDIDGAAACSESDVSDSDEDDDGGGGGHSKKVFLDREYKGAFQYFLFSVSFPVMVCLVC